MANSSKGKAVILPKTLNPATGKESTRESGFNEINWGEPTRFYMRSINKKLRDHKFNEIISRAKEFAKKTRHKEYIEDIAASGTENGDEGDVLMDLSSDEEDDNSDCTLKFHFIRVV